MNRIHRPAGTIAVVLGGLVLSWCAASAGSASVIDGVYSVTWSEKELLAAGAADAYVAGNFGYLHGRHGGITMQLRDGQFRLREALLPQFLCGGTYAVTKTTVSIQLISGCHGRITARWSLRNGRLTLRVSRATDPGDEVTFGGKPWKQVG